MIYAYDSDYDGPDSTKCVSCEEYMGINLDPKDELCDDCIEKEKDNEYEKKLVK